jgi:predicted aspartyl protease
MGLTTLKVDIANPSKPREWTEIELLVDSGAIYSVVPGALLRRLGIRRISREEFSLADGSRVYRNKGVALFRYDKRKGGADVIFGESGDSALLGALSLEALGLSLDPLRRELKPLPMILGGWRPLGERVESRKRKS